MPVYDFRELTPQFVMNYFLYGQPTTPASLVDSSLVRLADQQAELHVLAASFMSSGPGRFVNPSMSTLVQNFFHLRFSEICGFALAIPSH